MRPLYLALLILPLFPNLIKMITIIQAMAITVAREIIRLFFIKYAFPCGGTILPKVSASKLQQP